MCIFSGLEKKQEHVLVGAGDGRETLSASSCQCHAILKTVKTY